MTLAIMMTMIVTLAGGWVLWQVARFVSDSRDRDALRETSFGAVTASALITTAMLCGPVFADTSGDEGDQAEPSVNRPADEPLIPLEPSDEPATEHDLDDAESLSQQDQEEAEVLERVEEELRRSSSEPVINLEADNAVLLTTDKPAWLDIPSEEALIQHKRAVASKLYFTSQETQEELAKVTRDAVNRYIDAYLGDDKAHMLVSIDDTYIRNNLVADEFDEVWEVKQFNQEMVKRHLLLDFNDGFREHLDGQWNDVLQTSKLLTTGLGAFGLLGLMGIAFAYLRLDTATKGYYSGRLQFLSAVAILALTAAGVIFANLNADWLRWM